MAITGRTSNFKAIFWLTETFAKSIIETFHKHHFGKHDQILNITKRI